MHLGISGNIKQSILRKMLGLGVMLLSAIFPLL